MTRFGQRLESAHRKQKLKDFGGWASKYFIADSNKYWRALHVMHKRTSHSKGGDDCSLYRIHSPNSIYSGTAVSDWIYASTCLPCVTEKGTCICSVTNRCTRVYRGCQGANKSVYPTNIPIGSILWNTALVRPKGLNSSVVVTSHRHRLWNIDPRRIPTWRGTLRKIKHGIIKPFSNSRSYKTFTT